MAWLFLKPLIVLFVFALAMFVLRRGLGPLLRKWLNASSEHADRVKAGTTCPCGYDLTKVDVPRCPECGRVAHFDATPQELGLTEQELLNIRAAQRRRAEELREDQAKTLRATPSAGRGTAK